MHTHIIKYMVHMYITISIYVAKNATLRSKATLHLDYAMYIQRRNVSKRNQVL